MDFWVRDRSSGAGGCQFIVYYLSIGREIVGTAFFEGYEWRSWSGSIQIRDGSNLPNLTDRNDVIWFLEQSNVPLPDGLTIEKIKSRGSWWAMDKDRSVSGRTSPVGTVFRYVARRGRDTNTSTVARPQAIFL